MPAPYPKARSFKRYLAEFIDRDAIAPILPCRALLSSQQAGWESVYLEHHHQPAYKTPEFSYPVYIVCIYLGSCTTVDNWSERTHFQRSVAAAGDITLYPANTRHWERTDRTSEFIDLHLDPSLFTEAAPDFGDRPLELLPHFAVRDPLVQQIAMALRAELQNEGNPLYAEAMAQALTVHLIQRYSSRNVVLPEPTGGLPPHKLRQVTDYIEAHLQQELRVKAIARLVQLSPYHFSRLFKQSTGLAPHQYILKRRIERARELLQTGEMAIAEVSQQVGFSSQSQLTRHCKKLLGVTPRKLFRRI